MKYTTILFDFDGCIANTLPIWLKSFRTTFDELQIALTDREIIDNAFHRWDAKPELKIPDVAIFAKMLYNYFNEFSQELKTHEHFEETIQTVRKHNMRTAVVTSTLRETIDEKLNVLGLSEYFDTTIAWDDTERNKPDPHPLQLAMKRLGAQPEETIMIGDNEVDIISAQKAGVTSVWFYPKENQLFYPENAFAFLEPDFTIESFPELLELLK